jgi:hypothetical protein
MWLVRRANPFAFVFLLRTYAALNNRIQNVVRRPARSCTSVDARAYMNEHRLESFDVCRYSMPRPAQDLRR